MRSEFDECFQTVGVMNAQYCCGMTKITWDYFRNGSPDIVMKLTIHTNTQNTPKKFHSNLPEGGTIFFYFFFKEQNIIIKLFLKKKIKGLPQNLAMPCEALAVSVVQCECFQRTERKRATKSCLLRIQCVSFVSVASFSTLYTTLW